MGLTDYMNVLRRYWWLLALGTLLAGGSGYVISKNIAPVYQVTTRLFVNQVQVAGLPSYGDLQTSERLTKTYSEMLHSKPILDETIKQLNLPISSGDLDQKITAQAIQNTQLFQVTVADTDPKRATAIANQLVPVFIKRLQDLQTENIRAARDQVDRDVNQTQQRITDTSNRLNQIRIAGNDANNPITTAEAQRLGNQLTQDQDQYSRLLETRQGIVLAQAQSLTSVSVIDPATVPTDPVSPHIAQNTVLGGLLGLLLAGGLGLLLIYFDDRIRHPEEVRERFNMIPLANVQYVPGGVPRVTADAGSNSEAMQELRLLRANLEFIAKSNALAVCVTSALPGEGKSTIAANLAVIEAQAGKRVVLIDANLRDPSIHKIFGLSNDEGLSTLLARKDRGIAPTLSDGPGGLQLLLAGPVPLNPAELLDSPQMSALIADLRTRADMIIFDSAPVLPVPDTVILQRHVDGTVLVKDVRQTGSKTLGQAISTLEHASGRIFGVVLNKVKANRRSGSYGEKPQPVSVPSRKIG